MRTLGNRLLIGLAGFLALGSAAGGLVIGGIEYLRSELRLVTSEYEQIQGYFRLHAHLTELYAEYGAVLADPDTAATLDVGALRQAINEQMLSLRADIERQTIEVTDGRYNPFAPDEANGTAAQTQLVSVANEIQAMLVEAETAEAHFRAGRTAEGLALLTDAFKRNPDEKLDPIIAEATRVKAEELRVGTQTAIGTVNAVRTGGIVFLVILAALMTATVLAVFLPFRRSTAFLQGQTDKLALGGSIAPASHVEGREFAALHDGLVRASATQAKLRDERDACEVRLGERTETLRQEQDALRRIDQIRRDFLADVSHELRTPLTVLRGVAEVALHTQSNDANELKRTLSRIIDETARVARIVDDLFFIARSQAGVLDLRTDIVDLAAVSQAAAQEAQAIARRARGRITWHGPAEAVEVEGDEDRLRQLFTILVDNAFKYGGRAPSVEVDHKVAGETITIDIRDHGPGVPEADLPHVFERLYRGATASAAPAGSGLGLPLAKSIVDGHGGAISLSNAEDGGAIARVVLPIFDADALEAATP